MATEDFDRKVNDLIAQIEHETALSDGTAEYESRIDDLEYELMSLIYNNLEEENPDRLTAFLLPTEDELNELNYLREGENG